MNTSAVELANRQSALKRVVLAVLGLGLVIGPSWDLWPGIVSWSALSPLIWIISFGAAAIGLIFLAAAVYGDTTVLTVRQDGGMLRKENLVRQRVIRVASSAIGPITVIAQEWSDGPATWSVTVAVEGMKPVVSESLPTQAEAVELAARVSLALGRSSEPLEPPR